MATTRIMPLHIGKGRTESQAISDITARLVIPENSVRNMSRKSCPIRRQKTPLTRWA